MLDAAEAIRPYLLGTQFDAWHGFLRTPADWVPVVRALWVCAISFLLSDQQSIYSEQLVNHEASPAHGGPGIAGQPRDE